MGYKVLLLLCLVAFSEAYKVLMIAHTPVRSLNILGEGYVRHLLNAGHEVTYMSVYPIKDKPQKHFRHIDLSSTNMNLISSDDLLNIGAIMRQPLNEQGDISWIQDMGVRVAVATFNNEAVKKLLADPKEKFDVVISELLESELYAAIAALYDCPMIWAYSMGAHWTTTRLVDDITNPAYATDYITPDTAPIHSVYARTNKVWTQIKWLYLKWAKTQPREEDFYYEYFKSLFESRNKLLPDYGTVLYNSSLVLSNDFPGNGLMPRLPQNFKFIGGYHIETPPKPLPNDIKQILDNAKQGFIYFSMGSTWQSKDIPAEVTRGLLEMFGSLKVTVIWKYEEDLKNVPKNVHILKWAPQTSILGHPNILFFITHGGLLSSLESVHFAVPQIGVPIYFDQFVNINRGVARGSALRVDLTIDLPKTLKVAVEKMLRDSTYKQRAKEISAIFHDRTASPGQELVHWVEHVIKTGGAPHLRSPAFLMPWWEKLFADVIVIVSIIISGIVLIMKRIKKSAGSKKTNRKKIN